MKEITLLSQNPQGILLTWPKHELAKRYRLEKLTATFTIQLVTYLDDNTIFLPREELQINTPYRITYLICDEGAGQEFSVETTEFFYPNATTLETLELVAIKSYEGGALSFYSNRHFDVYRVYDLSPSPRLLVETEDCHVTGRMIEEGKTYQVEGYKRDDEGELTLVAISEPYHCQFRPAIQPAEFKLSVVVPVYNCQDFLSRTIDSILLSNFPDLELLLVNDGSKDKSAEICDWYQENYPNVRAIHKENSGVCSARNRGMDEARGEFLAFVDNDDLVHPYMYQKLYEAALDEGTDIAIGQTLTRTDFNQSKVTLALSSVKEEVTTYTYQEMMAAKGTGKNIYFVAVWNKIVRTSIARKTRFVDQVPYYEDTAYTSSLYTYIDRFAMVKGAYYVWDKRKQKTVGTATNQYQKLPSEIIWRYYFLADLAPFYQGNRANPTVSDLVDFDIMKKLLTKFKKSNYSQVTTNVFKGMLKYYVREYGVSLEQFRDSDKEDLRELYQVWEDIAQSDVQEYDGWEDIPREFYP